MAGDSKPAFPRAQGLYDAMPRLWYNHISAGGALSVTLTNAEKQARRRERHLDVDGEKAASGARGGGQRENGTRRAMSSTVPN
jgi:hypothetical protein